MKSRVLIGVLVIALTAWLSWICRYEVSGELAFGDRHARPVLLDRWTGKTYVYRITAEETSITGAWRPAVTPAWQDAPLARAQPAK